MVNNKFNLTQKETARLIELIIKGSDAMEDNLDDALEFMALINNAGISDVEKAAKAEIIRHPELEVTLHDVTIKTVPDAKFELDIVAVNRDENSLNEDKSGDPKGNLGALRRLARFYALVDEVGSHNLHQGDCGGDSGEDNEQIEDDAERSI